MDYTTTASSWICPKCGRMVYGNQSHLCLSPQPTVVNLDPLGIVSAHNKLDEILRIVRARVAKPCFICAKESVAWTDMPYGSFYDGKVICGECCAKYIDPLLDLVRMAKGETPDE